MSIVDALKSSKPTFSLEFFPPKTPKGESALFQTLHELKPLAPAFVSITYGAGGSERHKTAEWARRIQSDVGLTAMAHLTCVGSTQEELREILEGYKTAGVRTLMAVRGDPPRNSATKDSGHFVQTEGGFRYASELIGFIRQEFGHTFAVAGGGYPEGHPESVSLEADLKRLKQKVDQGLDFVVTQLFFNNALYFGFIERARRIGIEVPIVPGLMPITDLAQIRRFMDSIGASIPGPLLSRLERASSPQEVLQIGIEHTTRQAQELLDAGVPGIHLYTLNKSPATRQVLSNVQHVVQLP